MSAGSQTADIYGANFYRLRAKMLKQGYDLQRADRNLRRCGNWQTDEEAWGGRAKAPDGRSVEVFSWQTVTDLLKRGPLTIAPECDARGGPPVITSWTRYEITREPDQ